MIHPVNEEEVKNILKGIHGKRQYKMSNQLQKDRNPTDYLKKIDEEDKKFNKIIEALQEYFAPEDLEES
jgi:hypothetical protein